MPAEPIVTAPPNVPASPSHTPLGPIRRLCPSRRAAVVTAALLAGWLAPLAAYALHWPWLLPPLVLLTTASLLRGGRTLLDRLMIAVLLLVGVTTAAGLLFAVWPWGMHPVPVSGAAMTVLVLVAVATGRRPVLPRPSWTDLFPLAGTAALVTYLAQPLLRAGDLVGQLTILGRGEDNIRHLALVDAIGRLGGYVFVDPAATRDQLFSGLTYYPQGWHLVTALLDSHLTPVGAAPRGTDAVEPYLWWTIAGFGLMVLTLLWAAQRLPGPLHPLHRGTLTVVVGALLLGTQMPRLLLAGFPSEVLGLTLTVALAALVARPVAGTREQILLLGALLTGVGFAYYLFLPAAGVLVLCWLLGHRRELARARRTLVLVALAAAALAPAPLLLGVLRAGQTEALATPIGPVVIETWWALLGLGALVVPALIAHAIRTHFTDPAWHRWLLVILVGVGLTLAIAQANIRLGGEPGYYFTKAGHLTTALLIVGTAALVRLLPAPRRDGGTSRRIRTTVAAALTAVVLMVTAVALCGVTGWHRSLLVREPHTWAQRWVHQEVEQPSRAAVVCEEVNRRYPAVPGVTTLVLDKGAYRAYLASLCVSTLQGTTAQTEPGIYGMIFLEPGRTWQMLHRTPGEIRLVVVAPGAKRRVEKLLRSVPEIRPRVTVEVMLIEEPVIEP